MSAIRYDIQVNQKPRTSPDFTVFDRYAPLTDLPALQAFSSRALRKSVRVNTLKMSVGDFEAYAADKGWNLEPVAWCPEAFFIDRADRSEALGRDLHHLLGHFYMQEAASMLPPALLSVQPGEVILDMSAAPGSKTTQMAGHMESRGVIVANDVQEKRLWTLKNALHRSGVANVIVTKKVGQWFGKHMTERFDAVLCDAPCTAQGTVRKDSDALRYCSRDSIEKMSRLQFQLLEAAVHAAKVGGRIVYSTCTLTPEENEGVISQILNKFSVQLEVIDPRALGITPEGFWNKAIEDSQKVQEHYALAAHRSVPFPALRLWPQTYDTEGFFCAVLKKTAPTRHPERMDRVHFQERELPKSRLHSVGSQLRERYGSTFLREQDRLFERGESLLLGTEDMARFAMPVQDYSLGLPFAKRLKDGRILPEHELITLRGAEAVRNVVEVSEDDLVTLLKAQGIDCPADAVGHVLLRCNGLMIGMGLAKDGRLKNNLPRWMVQYNA